MKNQKGQAIVELALITPLLLVALYIPIDFGIAMFQAHLTNNAVREVARMASIRDPGTFNATALRTELINRLPKYVTVSGAPSITRFTGPGNCMKVVTVSATINYPLTWYRMLRLIGFNAPTALSITRTTQMHYEYQNPCSPGSCPVTPCTS